MRSFLSHPQITRMYADKTRIDGLILDLRSLRDLWLNSPLDPMRPNHGVLVLLSTSWRVYKIFCHLVSDGEITFSGIKTVVSRREQGSEAESLILCAKTPRTMSPLINTKCTRLC